MKAIQITLGEDLLKELDVHEETRTAGRSAVIRRALVQYLRRRRAQSIAEQYRRAYGDGRPDTELDGWSEEGVWPET